MVQYFLPILDADLLGSHSLTYSRASWNHTPVDRNRLPRDDEHEATHV